MSRISSFDELFNKIEEAFNSPLPIKWIKTSTNWEGSFTTNNNDYCISVSMEKYDIWKYKFFSKKNGISVKLTNHNYDNFKVLATIRKGISEFLDEVNPNGIIFGADNDSPKRVKIYTIFSNDCVREYGYNLYESGFDDKEINPTIFVLYREATPDELFDVIGDEAGNIG